MKISEYKKLKKGKTPETQVKDQVKDYLKMRGIFNYHLLAGIGAYKGAPDRIMHYNGKVVYLEIKKKKGVLSEHQIEFQRICKQDGIDYQVIRNLEDLVNFIEQCRK